MISLQSIYRFFLVIVLTSSAFTPCLSAEPPEPPPLPQTLDGEIPENLLPFEPLKAQTPEEMKKVEAAAHFMNGVVQEKRKNWSEAMREYAKAIQADPQAIEAYRALIRLNVEFKRPETAQALLVQALKYAPEDANLLQLLGSNLRSLQQFEQAIAAFEKALALPEIEEGTQKHTLLLLELAPLYRAAKKSEKAAELYAKIFKIFQQPSNYGLNYRAVRLITSEQAFSYDTIGQVFLEAENYPLALEAFNLALKNPRLKQEEIRYFKAQVFLAQNKPQQALDELEPYIEKKLQSQGLGPYQLLMKIYAALDREEEIEPRLEELQEQDKNNNFLLYALADYYRQQNKNAKAIDLYQQAIGRGADPEGYQGLMDVYYSEGRAADWLGALSGLLGLGREVEGMEDLFKQVSDDDEFMKKLVAAAHELKAADSRKFGYPEAYIIGRLAAASKRTEYVVEFYKLAMEFRPIQRPKLTGELTQYLTEQEEHLLAADLLEEAMNAPGNPQLKAAYRQLLAQSLMSISYDQEQAGEREKALATIQRAQEALPDNPLLTYRRGWLEWRNEHTQTAIDIFQGLIDKVDFRTLDNNPQLQNLIKQCHFLLSAIYVEEGNVDKGQKILETVYEHDPNDPSVCNDLGYLYADQNIKLDQAEKMIRLAVEAEPENHAYLDSMGWVLYRQGKLDEAEKYLLKAVEGSEKGDATLWDHLGDVYDKMGNIAKAKESWETALKQAEADDRPDPDLMNKIRKKLGLPVKDEAKTTDAKPIPAPKPATE
ncbi:MAG: tetratricopeptide repeat protein [Planctomycetaceae bacterium]|nr:tetratricopeptide repeat protein [Planctomycetaceae bacterium]